MNALSNRIAKATRYADKMQGSHAASAVLADIDGWTREDWNLCADALDENPPSDATVALIVATLEDRARREAPGYDPFEGLV